MANSAQRIQFLVSHEEGFSRSRLPALYSDFRGMRTHNPEGYAANIAAWRRALASLVRWGLLPSASVPATSNAAKATTTGTARNILILSAGPSLLDALHNDRYGSPDALDAVIREAVEGRDLAPLPAFLKAQESIYSRNSSWAAWAASIPWTVLSWGLHQLVGAAGGIGMGGGKIPSQQYVVLANVEAAAAAFADKTADLRDRFERTWSVAHFKRMFGRPGAVFDGSGSESDLVDGAALRLSDVDLDVLLVFLSRDKGLVAYDGQVVTLLQGGGNSKNAPSITEEDRAVAQLRELIESLTHQTGVLSRRIDELTDTARDAALRKNRVAALAALRQKKQTEAALTSRYATLAQLEATAAKIEQAADHVQIVQAMDTSGEALKTLNAQVGGVEAVENAVDRLRSQMEATDEIGRILAEEATIGTAGGIDEAEIDEELAALEQQEQKKQQQSTTETEALAAKQREAEAVEETKRRLAAIEQVPDKLDAALEAETTKSLQGLSLN